MAGMFARALYLVILKVTTVFKSNAWIILVMKIGLENRDTCGLDFIIVGPK